MVYQTGTIISTNNVHHIRQGIYATLSGGAMDGCDCGTRLLTVRLLIGAFIPGIERNGIQYERQLIGGAEACPARTSLAFYSYL